MKLLSYILLGFIAFIAGMFTARLHITPEHQELSRSGPSFSRAQLIALTRPALLSTVDSDIVARLRVAGFSKEIIADVVRGMISRRFDIQLRQIMFPAGTPIWKRRTFQPSPAQSKAIADLKKACNDEFKATMGTDYTQVALRPGNVYIDFLGTDKQNQVTLIVNDYTEAQRKATSLSTSSRRAVEANMQQDLAAVLSPDEMATYMAYNSITAVRLQQRLGASNLNDDAYRSLYNAVDALQQESFKTGGPNADMSFAYRVREFDLITQSVDADTAANFALSADSGFKALAANIKAAGGDNAAIVDRYRVYLDFHRQLEALNGTDPTIMQAKMTPIINATYPKLTAGFNDQQRSQFDTSPLGSFIKRTLAGQVGRR